MPCSSLPSTLFALCLGTLATACSPALEVGTGWVEGTLGPVSLSSAVVPTSRCGGDGCGTTRVDLRAVGDDGRILMMIAYLPASLADAEPGVTAEDVEVVGCARLASTAGWDVDRYANRAEVRIEAVDDPEWRRAIVHAELDLAEGTQSVDGWLDYTSDALRSE